MQLLKYFVTVLLAVLLLTCLATWLANKGLNRSGVDFYGKLNATTDTGKHTSLLLVGSSRALVQLNPLIFDSVTGLNSYNYGLNAGSIKTWANIIQAAVTFQKQTTVVVLNIDYNTFDIDADPYKDAYYYPFELKLQDAIFTSSNKIKLVHKLKLFDVSLYDDYAKYAAVDGWIRPGRVAAGGYKGFYPYPPANTMQPFTGVDTSKRYFIISPAGLKLLQNCMQLCNKSNVKLVLVMAPYFKKYSPEKYFLNFQNLKDSVQQLAKQNNVPFFDYTNTSFSNEQTYFYDVTHLNSQGANIYSLLVANSLQHYLATGKSNFLK